MIDGRSDETQFRTCTSNAAVTTTPRSTVFHPTIINSIDFLAKRPHHPNWMTPVVPRGNLILLKTPPQTQILRETKIHTNSFCGKTRTLHEANIAHTAPRSASTDGCACWGARTCLRQWQVFLVRTLEIPRCCHVQVNRHLLSTNCGLLLSYVQGRTCCVQGLR